MKTINVTEKVRGQDCEEKMTKKNRVEVEKEREVVICNDVEKFIAKTIKERKLNPKQCQDQVGLDDSQDLLKVRYLLLKKKK